ncbi:MAG TPA: chemoreceptor glutamine deamidase CheD, partial [Chromatiales bacterium]|nr:chemoreceptor glutamine deamidase CheD [Chromatiales bacterium]HEX22804.1 chemoreceptor glutamine deamidase CheD [Chromatiales bacterium]
MALLKAKTPSELPPALEGFEDIKRYWDKTNDKYAAKILPGEVYV